MNVVDDVAARVLLMDNECGDCDENGYDYDDDERVGDVLLEFGLLLDLRC